MTEETLVSPDLPGVWRLEQARAVDAAGVPLSDPWGPAPMGSLTIDSSGRMMAVLCDGRAAMPDGQERMYSSYCGAYVVAGNTLTTTVDAASDRSRIGSKQVREFDLDGDRLVLRPPARADGSRRELVWRRVGAAA